jgi:hypothetical protein
MANSDSEQAPWVDCNGFTEADWDHAYDQWAQQSKYESEQDSDFEAP